VLLAPGLLVALFLVLFLADSFLGSSRHLRSLEAAFVASLCAWVVVCVLRGGVEEAKPEEPGPPVPAGPPRPLYLAYWVGFLLLVAVVEGSGGFLVLVLVHALTLALWSVGHALQRLGRSWSAGRLAAPREPLSRDGLPRVLEMAVDARVTARSRSALISRLGTLEPASEVLVLTLREMSRVGNPSLDAEACARAVEALEQRLLREGPRTREERLLREVPVLHAVLEAFSARRARRLVTRWLAHAGVSRDELSRLESHARVGTHARALASLWAAPEKAGGPPPGLTRRGRAGAPAAWAGRPWGGW
jgi:hypothetical protein